MFRADISHSKTIHNIRDSVIRLKKINKCRRTQYDFSQNHKTYIPYIQINKVTENQNFVYIIKVQALK